jgi:hypothetical protein
MQHLLREVLHFYLERGELKTDEGLVESFVHTPLWKSNVRSTLAQFGIRER